MPERAPLVERLRGSAATVAAGRRLAEALTRSGASSSVVYLEGELGAGKTTFARGVMAGLGHAGRVPSPTYTLIETYDLPGGRVCHVDLYRVRDPRELDDLGLPELLESGTHALIEWPDHGAGHLPAPDLVVRLEIQAPGRRLTLTASSGTGSDLLTTMRRQA